MLTDVASLCLRRNVALLVLLITSIAIAKVHGQAIASRNQDDFRVFLELGQLPNPPAPVNVGGHGKAVKIASKYDVTKIGSRGVEKGVNFYSLEREQALGKELSQEIESSCKLLDDPKVTDYSLGRSVIYCGFAWSEAEAAHKVVKELAVKHGVGYFDVSAGDGEILFPTASAERERLK